MGQLYEAVVKYYIRCLNIKHSAWHKGAQNPLLSLCPSSRNLVLLLWIVKLKSLDLLSLIWRPHWSWYLLGPVLLEAVSVSPKVQLEANRAIIQKRNSNGGRVGTGMNKGHNPIESPLLSTMLRGTSEGILSPIGGQYQSPWSYDATNGSIFFQARVPFGHLWGTG